MHIYLCGNKNTGKSFFTILLVVLITKAFDFVLWIYYVINKISNTYENNTAYKLTRNDPTYLNENQIDILL